MKQELLEVFRSHFGPQLLEEISDVGQLVSLPENEVVVNIGSYVKSIPLLLSGAIKVMREDDDGDELLLYYLEQGETCSVTTACCLGHTQSEIMAVTETPSQLVMVPAQKMEEWMGKYPGWRKFIMESYHNRMNELLQTVDSIAFKNLDQRLIDYLKKKSEISNDTYLKSTHQEIAMDLHTSRVVVSRLLKKLEKLGKLELHRNHIKIVDL